MSPLEKYKKLRKKEQVPIEFKENVDGREEQKSITLVKSLFWKQEILERVEHLGSHIWKDKKWEKALLDKSAIDDQKDEGLHFLITSLSLLMLEAPQMQLQCGRNYVTSMNQLMIWVCTIRRNPLPSAS